MAPLEAEVLDLPPRANSVRAQIDPEFVARVAELLRQAEKGKGVAVGKPVKSDTAARTVTSAVRDELAKLDPPVYVNSHAVPTGSEDPEAKFQPAVSLTANGEPNKRMGKRGPRKPKDTPAADAGRPAKAGQ